MTLLQRVGSAACTKMSLICCRYVMPNRIWKRAFSGLTKPSLRLHTEGPMWRMVVRHVRQKRHSLTPVDEVVGDAAVITDLIKPFGFTILVSGLSFAGAAMWQYETLRKLVGEYKHSGPQHANPFYEKAGSFRHQANTWWNALSPGRRLVAGIIGINVGVFCLWRIPALQAQMIKFFAASPSSGAPCWSLLFSTFSHYSTFHLAANMYVLWSFSEPVCNLLGREQFLAVYLSAGLISGLGSYAVKVVRGSTVPSLGASGAIMAILGMVCSQYPNAELSIAFVGDIFPHSFSASAAMKSLIAFDTLGILLKWRFFDHAAHLGGILFGLWYIKYGHKFIWGNREPFLKWWHDVRGKP